jgi:hypothetical protein
VGKVEGALSRDMALGYPLLILLIVAVAKVSGNRGTVFIADDEIEGLQKVVRHHSSASAV